MKRIIPFLRLFFRISSALNPKWAGRQAGLLFQRTKRMPLREQERPLLEESIAFNVPHDPEPVQAYQMGDPSGPLVFLVHGWNAHAGSMLAIGRRLATQGYRVISLDLPGHGKSRQKLGNLKVFADAFQAVIDYIEPIGPFSVVSHSLGSGVSAYALMRGQYQVDTFVMLTTPDRFETIFAEFANFLRLNKKAYEAMLDMFSDIIGRRVEAMRVPEFCQKVNFRHIRLIHGLQDKVLPFKNSEAFTRFVPEAEVYPISRTGHYRMLWQDNVLDLMMEGFGRVSPERV